MIEKKIKHIFEKSYSISWNNKYFCCVGGERVNLYDTVSIANILRLNGFKQACYSQFTSDNKLIIKAKGGYYIYNMDTGLLVKRIQCPRVIKCGSSEFTLTHNNKFIIDFAEMFPNDKLLVIDVKSEKTALYAFGAGRVPSLFYDDIDSKYYIVARSGDDSSKQLYSLYYSFDSDFELDTITIQQLPYVQGDYSQISYNHGKFAYATYDGDIIIFDTVNNKKDVIKYGKDGVLYHMKLSQNGKLIALAESRRILVLDVTKKRILETFDVNYGCYVDFYDNDTKLLIGTWEKGFCVSI
ncbi:MAG: hypothetical protein J5592_01230 [Clostridia bacterium]|nr:hypothetical protein [Clostridia bacterium]